ncbi:MAG: DUF2785 domain-containing protein [Colwelliaceae bacterium]|nr:DUF2785 domain-containing protein [Colwelliaceae bacterium]
MIKITLISLLINLVLISFSIESKGIKAINADAIVAKCKSSSWNKEKLLALKKQDFVIEDNEIKQEVAKILLHCLASSDPIIRDQIAFTGLSKWFRDNSFNAEFYNEAFTLLVNVIEADVLDNNDVYKSFSALTLAEIVRVDRKNPFLNNYQHERVVKVATEFLHSIDDYRGYDEVIGWRHSVAHSADLMLQLALNPAIEKNQLDKILSVLSKQIVAKNDHFYIYGEAKRIAMPIVYIFLNEGYQIEDWNLWINKLVSPLPFAKWGDVFESQQGLSKRHNTQNFLYAFYALIKSSKNEKLKSMVPALEQAIRTVN